MHARDVRRGGSLCLRGDSQLSVVAGAGDHRRQGGARRARADRTELLCASRGGLTRRERGSRREAAPTFTRIAGPKSTFAHRSSPAAAVGSRSGVARAGRSRRAARRRARRVRLDGTGLGTPALGARRSARAGLGWSLERRGSRTSDVGYLNIKVKTRGRGATPVPSCVHVSNPAVKSRLSR